MSKKSQAAVAAVVEQAPVAEEQAAEPTKGVKRSQAEQLKLYKERYEPYQSPNGNISMDNGDAIAQLFRGCSPEAIMSAAEALKGMEPGTLEDKYASLNPGSRRMNAGNMIRALERRGDTTVDAIRKALAKASQALNAVAE